MPPEFPVDPRPMRRRSGGFRRFLDQAQARAELIRQVSALPAHGGWQAEARGVRRSPRSPQRGPGDPVRVPPLSKAARPAALGPRAGCLGCSTWATQCGRWIPPLDGAGAGRRFAAASNPHLENRHSRLTDRPRPTLKNPKPPHGGRDGQAGGSAHQLVITSKIPA